MSLPGTYRGLAGPGGVGKSTLVHREQLSGAVSTCDNVCVSDGQCTWGLGEPLRLPVEVHAGKGRRMPYGRREAAWPRRTDRMAPDLLVVLVRGTKPGVTRCDQALAARHLAPAASPSRQALFDLSQGFLFCYQAFGRDIGGHGGGADHSGGRCSRSQQSHSEWIG